MIKINIFILFLMAFFKQLRSLVVDLFIIFGIFFFIYLGICFFNGSLTGIPVIDTLTEERVDLLQDNE